MAAGAAGASDDPDEEIRAEAAEPVVPEDLDIEAQLEKDGAVGGDEATGDEP